MTHYFSKIGVALALVSLAISPAGYSKEGDEKAAGGSLEEKMVGYWAPDAAAMKERIMKEVGEDPNAAAMLPMIEAMLAAMVVEVKKGEVSINVMGQAQKSTYKITKTDAAASKLTMMVKDEDGEEEGTATIKGDKLTLSKDGEDIVLNRIDKKEFDKRKAKQADVPGFPVPPAPPE